MLFVCEGMYDPYGYDSYGYDDYSYGFDDYTGGYDYYGADMSYAMPAPRPMAFGRGRAMGAAAVCDTSAHSYIGLFFLSLSDIYLKDDLLELVEYLFAQLLTVL